MATAADGAGAIGAASVLLRMRIPRNIASWNFRQVGVSTEVRTTTPIPAAMLEWYNKAEKAWKPL